MLFRNCSGRKRIIVSQEDIVNDPLVISIASAFRWQAMIDSGKSSNVNDRSRAIGDDRAYVSRVIRFTLFAPGIVHAALNRELKKKIGVERFKQAFPAVQERHKQKFPVTEEFPGTGPFFTICG